MARLVCKSLKLPGGMLGDEYIKAFDTPITFGGCCGPIIGFEGTSMVVEVCDTFEWPI